MASPTNISEKRGEIAEICRRFGVRELLLFGSALGPDFREESDYDLLVEFETTAQIGLIQLGLLQQELERLLERKVDLVPKRGLKPMVRERVLEHTEPLYAG